ncbi:isopeptide-forming domain-containing fimbrial protein, partial [Acaricomes phytoseiuli]|uniref:DUF7927 domain-containing protein n=1 Tax=Acaricomes phytoseiuli TaxID=291968 RepID=UPI0005B8E18E
SVKNSGSVDTTTDAVATDDMSQVLDKADLVDGPTASVGSAVLDGTTVRWSGALRAGESATITYSVKIKDGATGTLRNYLIEPDIEVVHPLIEYAKVADPISGSKVERGQVINYTLTARNPGNVPYDNATLTDDLKGVLPRADVLPGTLSASSGQAVLDGSYIRWQGTVGAGQTVTVTFQVKVKDNAAAGRITNTLLETGEQTWHEIDGLEPPLPPTGAGGVVLMMLLGLGILGSGALLLLTAGKRRKN